MEGSTILGWMGLGSASLAVGSLVRSRVQPTAEDPRTQSFTELLTVLWLSISLGAVQKAFSVKGDAIGWSIEAIQIALLVVLVIQLRRAWRVKTHDSSTPL